MVKGNSKSIRKKIAQLIIPRLEGKLLTDPLYLEKVKRFVREGMGGFILFGGNRGDVKMAIKELQRVSDIPLFIASDLEQGLGQQVEGGTIFPNAMALGSAIDKKDINDIRLLRKAIQIMATEAKGVGINTILAPVLDINTNPKNPIISTRAFSEDAEEVAWFGKEFISGIQRIPGLIACGKHFPGHGNTETDSHIELPVVKASIERLKRIELYPFIEAIKTGVKMIMVGHLVVEAIDPQRPASLSYKLINNLLRNQLGFNGIVITDAMNMGGIKGLCSEDESCLMAIRAGADMILHPDNPESVMEYLSSRWDEIGTRVEWSLKRILRAKGKLPPSPLSPSLKGRKIDGSSFYSVERDEGYPRTKTRKALVEILSEKAVRVLRGSPKLQKDSILLILDDDNSGAGKDFINALKERYPYIKDFYIDKINMPSKKKGVIKDIKGRPLIIGIFFNISAWKGRWGISQELKQFLKEALMGSRDSTVISFGSPYILDDIEADTLIAAYWNSEASQMAVAKILSKGGQ